MPFWATLTCIFKNKTRTTTPFPPPPQKACCIYHWCLCSSPSMVAQQGYVELTMENWDVNHTIYVRRGTISAVYFMYKSRAFSAEPVNTIVTAMDTVYVSGSLLFHDWHVTLCESTAQGYIMQQCIHLTKSCFNCFILNTHIYSD